MWLRRLATDVDLAPLALTLHRWRRPCTIDLDLALWAHFLVEIGLLVQGQRIWRVGDAFLVENRRRLLSDYVRPMNISARFQPFTGA